jgi:ParB-like chromosome segregation protein Spo0J
VKQLDQEFDPAIDIDKVHEHPDNPRKGDDRAVGESISRNGFFGAVLVQRSTGNIIAGNTRFRVMREEGMDTIPGFWVDCDDETATRILLADNRTSDLAFYDDEALFGLLRTLVESEGLDGTGYDRAAYELLLQSVESDSIVGGIRQGVLPEERIDAFNELDIRSLILPYEFARYEPVASGLAMLRTAWSMDSNADVVERLVEEALEDLSAKGAEFDPSLDVGAG